MTVTADVPAAFRRRGSIPDAYGWDDLSSVIALTGDAQHRHIPGSPMEYEHNYVPLTHAAAASHFGGSVPKGWHPKGGGGGEARAERPVVLRAGSELKPGDHVPSMPGSGVVASTSHVARSARAAGRTRVKFTDGKASNVRDGARIPVHPADGKAVPARSHAAAKAVPAVKPAAAKPADSLEVTRAGKNWLMREDGKPVESFSTRKAAQAKVDGVRAQRARLTQDEEDKRKRLAALLARHGLKQVDPTGLKPGDQFTVTPGAPLRTVTEAHPFGNGNMMVTFEKDAYTPRYQNVTPLGPSQPVYGPAGKKGASMSVTWDDLDSAIDLAVPAPVKAPAAKASPARLPGKPPGVPPVPPQRSPRKVPLTPMRQAAAKSMRKLAASVQESHPDMTVHDHLRDAARTLESGQEEASQRHLRAAMFALTPQSLMRNGLHTDDHHTAGRQVMHSVHRHLLLVKDIADVGAKNQAAIRRLGGEDDTAPRPEPDPNNGYGPGALAQKPTARQPGGDKALNAPARSSSGGSDPNVADPVGAQPKGSKQFAYGWGDLSALIEMANRTGTVELVGPKGYVHGWIYVGGAGLPSVAGHNAALKAKGVTPPTRAHPALTSKPPSVKAHTASPAKAAPKTLTAKATPKPAAAPAKSAPPVTAVKPGTPAPKPDPNAERLVNTLNLMSSFGGKSAQTATAKNISTSDLHAVDAEYRRQDLEKGRVAAGHKIVQEALANRGETALPVPTADDLAKGKVAAKAEATRARTPQEEREDMIGAWSTSYRYRGTTESKNLRTKAFATEMHRLLSTNKQPKTCGPGCQDAHKFLAMIDKESVPQDKELTRGVALSNSAAERMFKPGKKVDMPVASWTSDDHTAANYARPGKDGQVTVMLHAAPGAKGLDITKDSNWGTENEVVSGGRFSVDKVQTQDGVMHVYLTQGDFSAH